MTSDLSNQSHALATPGGGRSSLPHPGVGLHRDVPAEVYHGWQLPSSTLLNEMWRYSPAHAKLRTTEPLESGALRIGSAVHTLVLEGIDTLRERFAVGGPINPRTKDYYGADTKAFAEWAAEQTANGKEFLTVPEAEQVRGMALALQGHVDARVHLEATAGNREVSGIFKPFEDGDGLARFRPDGIAESFAALVDLKTTESANPWDVRSSILKWGYHRSAALYMEGATALGLDVVDFVFIFVEKKPPHGVGVYVLDPDDIGVGLIQVHDLLRRWYECEQAGVWPAYGERQTIRLPHWARLQTYAQRLGGDESFAGGDW